MNAPKFTKMLQICFSKDSSCHTVNIEADFIDKIDVLDGFLRVHDTLERCWHCYNLNEISHFHYPDKAVNSK